MQLVLGELMRVSITKALWMFDGYELGFVIGDSDSMVD